MYDLEGNWLAALLGHNKETVKNLDRLDILVLGKSGENTDTIVVFTYDPKVQQAGMLSIPRDTFAGDKGAPSYKDKINSVAERESPEETMKIVNEMTGLDIKYYAVVDSKILIELVDIIGGIEFDVPIDMEYDDNNQNLHIDLKAGTQKLSGNQVEQLVRFRHNNDGITYSWEYGIEDYGRMKTQRNVIKTIAKQTIKLKHIWRVGEIVDTIGENVNTNIDLGVVKNYIPYGMKINVEDIISEQLPGKDDKIKPVDSNGEVWFFFPDEEETEVIVDKVFGRYKEEEVEETKTNEVITNET